MNCIEVGKLGEELANLPSKQYLHPGESIVITIIDWSGIKQCVVKHAKGMSILEMNNSIRGYKVSLLLQSIEPTDLTVTED
jgi:hypothetical protein